MSFSKRKFSKSGQTSLFGVFIATSVGMLIVGSLTQWYISMNKNIDTSSEKLTAMSIVNDEWKKVTTQNYEELKNKSGTTEEENIGGYKLVKEYGNTGVFNESNGKCEVGKDVSLLNSRACVDITMKIFNKEEKQIFTASPTYVSSNMGYSYVKNDSFPNHHLSLQYNEEKNYIYGNVDGHNTVFQPAVPDWKTSKQLFFTHWGYDVGSFRYVAPENGYIMVLNCATNVDYSMMVNGSFAYHKCSYSNAGMGYVPVSKGDIITVALCSGNTIGGSPSWGTSFFFIPTKIQ